MAHFRLPRFPSLLVGIAVIFILTAALVSHAARGLTGRRGRLVATAPGDHVTIDPDAVDKAVAKGVAFLLGQQKGDGSWERSAPPGAYPPGKPDKARAFTWGGETAIATYALLAADQSAGEEKMKKAIAWLEKEDLHGTYAVGLRSQIYQYIPKTIRAKRFDYMRDRDRDFVIYSRIKSGDNKGFYAYSYGSDSVEKSEQAWKPIDHAGPTWEGYDRSNSQYGVLGAWALEEADAEIPGDFWTEEDAAWKKAQLSDGGWNYHNGNGPHSPASLTMTSAGIATLYITQDKVLRSANHSFESCNGGIANPNIDRGLKWMDAHIQLAFQNSTWPYYALYGIERIGVASGRKYFGAVDWYKRGADEILKSQQPNGSWGTVHDTAFALLFLCRGRAPVMMNKLIYETASKKQTDPWNERPRDLANLARWMGHHSTESFINWQLVTLKNSVEDLHDAPILYIAGSEQLQLSEQDMNKLRLFVEQGGLILGNADCGNRGFATSFKELGQTLFHKYEWRRLPANHPIYSEQYLASKWKIHPELQGLSNGVRELMILIPEFDPARFWQYEASMAHQEAFQLAGNIFLYATGKENLDRKGTTYIAHANATPAKHEIKVARLEVGDNWNPEPGAWPRLSAIMHNKYQTDVKAAPVKLGSGALAGYKIAHFTGTSRIALNADARKELKDFVTHGGTLLIDDSGASVDFGDSVEATLKELFGDAAIKGLAEPLAVDHPALGDCKTTVKRMFRNYARDLLVGSLRGPRIRGIDMGGRIGVFYSREDITSGLVGEPMDGIVGYDPAAATAIMANLLLYADRSTAPVADVAK